jgi:uncharacterized membrane-anchored protein YitT (DUF2179 family)
MKKNRVQWNTPHQMRQILMLALAVIMASIGLKGFLLPNHFLDGGVTGISLILNAITGCDLSLLIVLLNIPFVYMYN